MKELFIDAKIENLDAVIDFVAGELETEDCPIKLQTQVSIAVEEIFVNIAHYAYAPEGGKVVIRIAAHDEIIIKFEDNGKPYNPLEKIDPDVNAVTEEREIGGLGVFMVKQIMDSVEYEYKNGKNILTIVKTKEIK
jgi:anti-sigma regulatory factor (Ser/Thr protein kinase)